MDLPFVDHVGSLLVVVGFFALDYFWVGLADHCNYKVHEYHEQVEDAD